MSEKEKEKLLGKIIVEAKIENITPIIIGSGMEDKESDIIVIKDWENNFYIPATSFIGVLRHMMMPSCNENLEQYAYFWGIDNQSALIINDLISLNKPVITIRDGVAIDNKKGIAKDKAKYNFEVVEPGAIFKLFMEVNVRKAFDAQYFLKTISTILFLIKSGEISIGAMTAKGFGKVIIKDSSVCFLDFSKKGHSLSWLIQDYSALPRFDWESNEKFNVLNKKDFIIDAWFSIKSSLIIGAYSGDPEESDKSHIKSNDNYVATGTALKGVIRSRAEKIINTLGGNGEDGLKEMMGWVDTENKQNKIKSRLTIEETVINGASIEIQSRIKIDRFSGGVVSGALFDSQPLWRKSTSDSMVNIKMTLHDYHDWEAGLLLLILKDLWCGDLPVGGEKNVGRGVLQGIKATVKYPGTEIKISHERDGNLKIDGGDHKLFEHFVRKFTDEI